MAESVTFLDLCTTFEKISSTTKRLEIQQYLTEFLRHVIKNDHESLVPILFLCTARIYPEYYNIEMNIGDHMIQTTVAEASGMSVKAVQQKIVKTGDLATVAMENKVKQLFISTKRLTVADVFGQMRKIAKETGKNSTNVKKNLILSMLCVSSPLEIKYLVRLMEGSLKIGLALQTVLISLSHAFSEDDENNVENVKNAYNKLPDFEKLVGLILLFRIEGLDEACKISPGIPLKPMLAQPHTNLTKAFSKFGDEGFVSEFKYDGERVQIHHYDGKTRIFSRNSEEMSGKYPDIAGLDLSNKSFIIDGEAVAFEDGKILPFQVLSTRKRKNVEKIEVQVCVFAFDILFYDSQELLSLPLKERKKILYDNFKEIEGKFRFSDCNEFKNEEGIESHFKASIQGGCEGLMLKSQSSPYQPAQRTNSWIKIKKDYLENLGDSVDLIVMGAFYGKGKRTGSFGGFLLGVYNDEIDKYEACCKIGTGFSDEDLSKFYEEMSMIITADTSQYVYNKSIAPDIWLAPRHVWEVKAASLSLSPIYTAGSGTGKGISLRFPRFIRSRTDKGPKDASTSNQILRMYNDSLTADSEDEFN